MPRTTTPRTADFVRVYELMVLMDPYCGALTFVDDMPACGDLSEHVVLGVN